MQNFNTICCVWVWSNVISTDTTNSVTVGNCRQTRLTLSLDENLLYRGSSFINFFTSFHCDVNVMSAVSDSNRWNISRFFFVSALICSSCSFCFSERSISSQSDQRWSFRSSFLFSCQEPSTLRTYTTHKGCYYASNIKQGDLSLLGFSVQALTCCCWNSLPLLLFTMPEASSS